MFLSFLIKQKAKFCVAKARAAHQHAEAKLERFIDSANQLANLCKQQAVSDTSVQKLAVNLDGIRSELIAVIGARLY